MLAKTAPMGWNSWNTFGNNIDEKLIFEIADRMAEDGYLEAGYEYLVIDDCWSLKQRDENDRLVADPDKFPHGMKYVADYVHSKGLKFGMYSCAGILTCAGYPASFDHEFVDAETFASWGVDYLKYDFCHFPANADCKTRYRMMAIALKATGRDILLNACNWGVEEPWEWMRGAGVQMYRSTGDINDSFRSIMDIANSQEKNLGYNGPYSYNDMDMLVVGMYGKGNVAVTGCTDAEYKTHFALWSLFGVPLIIGADLRNLNDFCKELLLNKELIRIDQDPESRAPYRIYSEGEESTRSYFKHLSDGTYAIGMFNLHDDERTVWARFEDAGLPYAAGYDLELTDIFTGETIGVFREFYSVPIAAHDCRVFTARLVKR